MNNEQPERPARAASARDLRAAGRAAWLASRAAGDAAALVTGGPVKLGRRVARRSLRRALWRLW